MLIPWFHARRAMPKAAVDFPLPSPVLTAVTGSIRRCRVVNPSLGMFAGSTFPLGIVVSLLSDCLCLRACVYAIIAVLIQS